MATFFFQVALIVVALALQVSPSQSLSPITSQPKKSKNTTPTISAAPTSLPDPPLSPYTELTPEIAPLLPSPGSTIPTIPSNPSPPNPDQVSSVGPDSAFAPSGSLPASSAASLHPRNLEFLKVLKLLSFLVLLVSVCS